MWPKIPKYEHILQFVFTEMCIFVTNQDSETIQNQTAIKQK